MNHLEISTEILLITIAIVVVAANVLVRLVLLPGRRDKFIGELLDNLMEPATATESVPSAEQSLVLPSDLREPLLRHFEKSTASRQILHTLANGEGMSPKELSAAVNQSLAERGKPPLPLAVARRVAIALLQAGLVGIENGALRITELGRNLNLLLEGRKKAARQLALSS
jgi:hypothetical protein